MDDSKITSGFVFKMNGSVVSWKSSKKDTTTNSTIEAEYIVASVATEAIWMRNFAQELDVIPNRVDLVLVYDNYMGAVCKQRSKVLSMIQT